MYQNTKEAPEFQSDVQRCRVACSLICSASVAIRPTCPAKSLLPKPAYHDPLQAAKTNTTMSVG